MSTAQPPQETLIPSLPNDVAINILARIPRSLHPILASVSKSIRALLSSPLLYTTRAILNSSQPFLCLALRVPSTRSLLFYTLHQSPHRQQPLLAPLPHSLPASRRLRCRRRRSHFLPHRGVRRRCAVLARVGPRLPAKHVGKSPQHARGARVPGGRRVDGKVYVLGGCLVDTWSKKQKLGRRGKVYAMADRGGVKFDPKEMSWESVESELDLGWRGRGCVVDGVLYCYDYLGKIRGFDSGVWREVKGVVGGKGVKKGLSLPRFLCGATMANVGGKLVVVWEGRGGSEVEVWCAEIDVERGEGGELWGRILWCNVVLKVPEGSTIVNCAAVTV
ncbi:hypothetical protein Patl1_27574 [Pistacia atlantica]|uniref:Uncharacterized protein n=1 Tax=Pistacia atlantica TaxID=434234 RepID=A0ACC1BES0_9ROSI|nr:hypothetical protein Patl1_27574 [Pistacia atlantica]